MSSSTNSQRLISLDVLRGLTVMLMIFVNNGAGGEIFSILEHSKWNGMTPCDLVFPFFLFMMGMSTYLSLRKSNFEWSAKTGLKILKRGGLLFLIGLAIHWFELIVEGRPFDFAHLRIMAVMQRLGLCYAATALIVLAYINVSRQLGRKDGVKWGLPVLIVAILAFYGQWLLLYGGYDYDAATNGIARIDLAILGYDHIYHRGPVDPEGLVSTIPSIAHCLLGFWVAAWALGSKKEGETSALTRFLLCGAVLTMAGFLLSFGLPFNKRIWSPSYVLATCGLACLMQGVLTYLLDILPQHRAAEQGTTPGKERSWLVKLTLVFGTNPLFLYVASEVIAILFGTFGIKEAVYNGIHAVVTNGYWASVVYATAYVSLHAAMGYPLWKNKIYIKL